MKHDAIIFDIDGTLWNASQASAKGWNNGLARLNIKKKVTSKQIEGVAGNPYEKCIENLLPGLSSQYPELLDTLNTCEKEIVKSEGGIFYKKVKEGIRILAEFYKIFLVSNCQEWYLNLFIELSDLKPFLTGYDCYGLSCLPKNEMLVKIKKKHFIKNPVYIGDTAGDETAANQANMEFFHASYGFGTPVNKVVTFHSFPALIDYFTFRKISP